jgi:hypothetical protein
MDVLQLVVHLTHHVGGRCSQSVRKCGHGGYVLDGLGEGGAWHAVAVDGGSDCSGLSAGFGEVDHDGPLCLKCGLAVV